VVVVGQRRDAQRLQGAPVVLLGVVEGGAGGVVERAQGGEFQPLTADRMTTPFSSATSTGASTVVLIFPVVRG
jgi:hypothetical protein